MNIKQIKQVSRDAHNEILGIAKSIHPNLFGRLQYHEFYDESLRDNTLQLRYETQLVPIIMEYKDELQSLKEKYLTQFFEDYMELDAEEYGIDLGSGRVISNPSGWLSADSFLPCPEVQKIYDSVLEIHSYKTRMRPFWEYDTYSVSTPQLVVQVDRASTPTIYIDNARRKMGAHHVNAVHLLVQAAKDINTIGYDIHIPPLSTYDEKNMANNTILAAVQRHKKLKDFLDGTHSKTEESYYSELQDNYSYTFRGRNF